MLTDSFGRRIEYLRLSVTDRCNLRCVYCLPESYARFAPSEELLSDDEIVRLVSCFAEAGISRLRVTGGEPLVRPGITRLIGRLAAIRGIADTALTTNGVLLGGLAAELAQAGLKRVNVSLDSLDADTFRRITRFGELEDVLTGVEAALAAGLSPVKVNVVVARGLNDGEIRDFVELSETRPLHVRFIELMPMGETGFFSHERWMPLSEIMDRAGPLEPLPATAQPAGGGPARCFKRPGGKGTVGFIGALSRGFCASCNRMRLSARGTLVPCLDGSEGTDFRALLRNGADSAELRRRFIEAVRAKPEGHAMLERAAAKPRAGASGTPADPRFMCQIGG